MELYVINWLNPLLMLELHLHFIMSSSSQQKHEPLSSVYIMWQWYTHTVSLHSYAVQSLTSLDQSQAVPTQAISIFVKCLLILNVIWSVWIEKWRPSTNSGNSSRFLFTSHLFSLHQWQINQFWQAMWVKYVWLMFTWIFREMLTIFQNAISV